MSIWMIAAIVFVVLLIGGGLLLALVRWAAYITNDELDPASPRNFGRRHTDRINAQAAARLEAQEKARADFELECD